MAGSILVPLSKTDVREPKMQNAFCHLFPSQRPQAGTGVTKPGLNRRRDLSALKSKFYLAGKATAIAQSTPIETIKSDLQKVLETMSREDILELGDFIFDEARRRSDNRNRAWRFAAQPSQIEQID